GSTLVRYTAVVPRIAATQGPPHAGSKMRATSVACSASCGRTRSEYDNRYTRLPYLLTVCLLGPPLRGTFARAYTTPAPLVISSYEVASNGRDDNKPRTSSRARSRCGWAPSVGRLEANA